MDTYIISVNSDIEKFKLHVKKNQNDLAARGQKTHDLLANIFKADLNAIEKELTRFILTRQDSYDRGEYITIQSLMSDIENKFKTLKLQVKCNDLLKDQELIFDLTAEVIKLKDNKLKVTVGNKKVDSKNKRRKDLKIRILKSSIGKKFPSKKERVTPRFSKEIHTTGAQNIIHGLVIRLKKAMAKDIFLIRNRVKFLLRMNPQRLLQLVSRKSVNIFMTKSGQSWKRNDAFGIFIYFVSIFIVFSFWLNLKIL